MKTHARQGFTLIELSLVIVIIALLVGGVAAGKELIRLAAMRAIVTDVDNYRAAYNAFRGKYNCLPGDCSQATSFFGTDSSGCPSGGGTVGTCNGDGNDIINETNECRRAWQQMQLSGLIAGRFTGVGGSAIPGTNAPKTRVD